MPHPHVLRRLVMVSLTLAACDADDRSSGSPGLDGPVERKLTESIGANGQPASETEIIDGWNRARDTYLWLPNISNAGYHQALIALPAGNATDCNVITGGRLCPGALPRAVGNGTSDDGLALQAAIDAVGMHGGGTVFLPDHDDGTPRTYLVRNALFVRGSGIVLAGAPPRTTIAFARSLTAALGYENRIGGDPEGHTHWAYLGGMLWIGPPAKSSEARSDAEFAAAQSGWLTGDASDSHCVELDAAGRGATAISATGTVPSSWDYGRFYFVKLTQEFETPRPPFSTISRHLAGYDEPGTERFAQTFIAEQGEDNRHIRRPLVWPVRVSRASVTGATTTFHLDQALRFKLYPGASNAYRAYLCKPYNYEKNGSAPAFLSEVGVRDLTIEMKRDEAWGCGPKNTYPCCNGSTSSLCNGGRHYATDVEHGYDLTEETSLVGGHHELNFHDHETGWNGLYMERCINCFMDRVTVNNADSSVIISASKFVTARHVTTGTAVGAPPGFERNHHAFELRDSVADVLVHKCNVQQMTRHGLSMSEWNNGNVWSSCVLAHGTLDYHRGTSFDNVRTEITLQNPSGFYGGGPQSGALMGLRTVHWNIDAQATDQTLTEDGDPGEVSSWLPPKSNALAGSRGVGSLYLIAGMNLMPHGALVGVRGAALTGGKKMNYAPNPNLPPTQDMWTYADLLPDTASGAAVVLLPGQLPATRNLWVKQFALTHGGLSPQY